MLTATELVNSDRHYGNSGPLGVREEGRLCYASAHRAIRALRALVDYAEYRRAHRWHSLTTCSVASLWFARGRVRRPRKPLAPCPEKPNCVSSLAPDAEHQVEPLALAGDPAAAWSALRAAWRRCRALRSSRSGPDTCTPSARAGSSASSTISSCAQSEAGDRVDVRSASRVGYGDMGVNRDRVEALRAAAIAGGAVQ